MTFFLGCSFKPRPHTLAGKSNKAYDFDQVTFLESQPFFKPALEGL